MNLYFIQMQSTGNFSMDDFVILALNKQAAEEYAVKKLKRNVNKDKTRIVPHGHYIVGETFLNSEA